MADHTDTQGAPEPCIECDHAQHPLRSCHEIIGAIGGDPSNGPDYCACTIDYASGMMEAEIARLRAAATPGTAGPDRPTTLTPCWFCGRGFADDYLIAGYDTWDEQRLACLDCDRAIHALREKGWLATDTASTPEAEPLTAHEALHLIHRSLAEGLVLDHFAGTVPIFHRPSESKSTEPPDHSFFGDPAKCLLCDKAQMIYDVLDEIDRLSEDYGTTEWAQGVKGGHSFATARIRDFLAATPVPAESTREPHPCPGCDRIGHFGVPEDHDAGCMGAEPTPTDPGLRERFILELTGPGKPVQTPIDRLPRVTTRNAIAALDRALASTPEPPREPVSPYCACGCGGPEPQQPGIDAERLARAYANVEGAGEWTPNGRIPSAWVPRRVQMILAEYARLSTEPTKEGPDAAFVEATMRRVVPRDRHALIRAIARMAGFPVGTATAADYDRIIAVIDRTPATPVPAEPTREPVQQSPLLTDYTVKTIDCGIAECGWRGSEHTHSGQRRTGHPVQQPPEAEGLDVSRTNGGAVWDNSTNDWTRDPMRVRELLTGEGS